MIKDLAWTILLLACSASVRTSDVGMGLGRAELAEPMNAFFVNLGGPESGKRGRDGGVRYELAAVTREAGTIG
jgi:hypothetical protein